MNNGMHVSFAMNLFAGKERRHGGREWTCGHGRGGRGWDEWRKEHEHMS